LIDKIPIKTKYMKTEHILLGFRYSRNLSLIKKPNE